MKKKYFAVIAAMMTLMTVGCSGSDDASDSSSEKDAVVQAVETQPDPLDSSQNDDNKDPEESTKEVETTIAATAQATTAAEPVSETSEASAEASEQPNGEGGVVNLKVTDSTSDEELIAAGQELFRAACETSWKFHVGCPYTVDYETTAVNSLGWDMYLITDENIKSIADIEADYNKVFSSSYPNDLSEIYMEQDGNVYALDGDRGSNVYYMESVITGVTQRQDNEIIFNVENRYSGDDYTGEGEYTENAEFSAVVDESGAWYAGLFNLPY